MDMLLLRVYASEESDFLKTLTMNFCSVPTEYMEAACDITGVVYGSSDELVAKHGKETEVIPLQAFPFPKGKKYERIPVICTETIDTTLSELKSRWCLNEKSDEGRLYTCFRTYNHLLRRFLLGKDFFFRSEDTAVRPAYFDFGGALSLTSVLEDEGIGAFAGAARNKIHEEGNLYHLSRVQIDGMIKELVRSVSESTRPRRKIMRFYDLQYHFKNWRHLKLV